MKIRWIILLGILLTGILAVGFGLQRRARSQEQRLENLRARLADADPARRADAARGILEIDAARDEVRLLLARALIETGQPMAARRVLGWFQDERSPRHVEAQLVRAETYVVEAKQAAARTRPATVDMTRQVVEERLEKAALIRGQLAAGPEQRVQIAVLEARGFACLLVLDRQNLHGLALRLTKAQDYGFGMQTEAVGSDIAQLRKRIASTQTRLTEVCDRIIGLDPSNAAARALLFDQFLQMGAFDQARATAAQLADLPQVDAATVGPVAQALLNLETLYAQEPSPADQALARRLLEHPRLARARHIAVRVARLTLQLRDGHIEQAHEEAAEILADYPGHPRAECLFAEAQIGLGQAEQAVDRLERFRHRVDSWRVVYSLGRAMIAAGRTQAGQQTLRQSLDMRSGSMSALLALVESMVDAGHVIEAEPHILAAVELNPDHRRALAYRVRLAVDRLDRAGLVMMLQRSGPAASQAAVAAEDVLLAVAMSLDNAAEVGQVSQTRLAHDPRDVLMLIADAWLNADPLTRAAVADLVLHTVSQQLEPDPLAYRRSPPLTASMRTRPGAMGSESLDGAWPVRQILAAAPFYAWPQAEALDLVQVALALWPQHPGLLDAAERLQLWLAWQVQTPQVPQWPTLHQDAPTARLIRLLQALRAGDDDSAVDRALQGLLERHRWSQLPALMVLASALEHDREDRIERVLELAGQSNPKLKLLVGARIDLAQGRPLEGLAKLDALQDGQANAAQIHRMTADLRARANLAAGRDDEAIGVFEALVMSAVDRPYAMQLAMIDVMADANRTDAAAAALISMLEAATTPAFWLDRVLARAETLVDPKRLVEGLERSMRSGARSLIELYQARTLIRLGDLTKAQKVAMRLGRRRPGAPRIIALADELAAELVRTRRDGPRSTGVDHQLSQSGSVEVSRYSRAPSEESPTGEQGVAVE